MNEYFEGIGLAITSIGGKGKDRPPTESQERKQVPVKKKK